MTGAPSIRLFSIPWVITLPVIMLDVFHHHSSEMTFAERDHAAETLVLDRLASPSRVRTGALHFVSRSQIST